MLFFPAFDSIDVFGPLEILQFLGYMHKIDVAFIAETLDPVSSLPLTENKFNSHTHTSLTPTHTIHTAPELDVLIVVGGPGVRSNSLNATIQFIKEKTPKVKQLITVCTGSGLAARSGVLDGKKVSQNTSHFPISPLSSVLTAM